MTFEYNVNHAQNRVVPYFSDLEKFGSIHPHINKVEKTDEGIKITESVRLFGFIPITNIYYVQVEIGTGQVVYKSQVKKNVYLEITFNFNGDGDKTKIEESIVINASTLVKKVLLRTLAEAHAKLIQNLNALKLN